MGYYCSCTDVKFNMKAENIEGALRALAPTQYSAADMFEEDILAVCDRGSFEEKRDLFATTLAENQYEVEFDNDDNVVGLTFLGEKWYDDTLFFNIFAPFVEKGSYIEMDGEGSDKWRMVFNGERCLEINPTVVWPEYDEIVNPLAPSVQEQAEKLISRTPALAYAVSARLEWNHHREDVLGEIAQRELPDGVELYDGDIDVITDRVERALSKCDPYYDAFWEVVGQVVDEYVKERPNERSLDNKIAEALEAQQGGNARFEKESVMDKEPSAVGEDR